VRRVRIITIVSITKFIIFELNFAVQDENTSADVENLSFVKSTYIDLASRLTQNIYMVCSCDRGKVAGRVLLGDTLFFANKEQSANTV
jgi:hypothetical protein